MSCSSTPRHYTLVWGLLSVSLLLNPILVRSVRTVPSELLLPSLLLTYGVAITALYRSHVLRFLLQFQHIQDTLSSHKRAWIGPVVVICAFAIEVATRLSLDHLPLIAAWIAVLVAFSWKIRGAYKERVDGAYVSQIAPRQAGTVLLFLGLGATRLFSFCAHLYCSFNGAALPVHVLITGVTIALFAALTPPAIPEGAPCGQCDSKINRLRHTKPFCYSCGRVLSSE